LGTSTGMRDKAELVPHKLQSCKDKSSTNLRFQPRMLAWPSYISSHTFEHDPLTFPVTHLSTTLLRFQSHVSHAPRSPRCPEAGSPTEPANNARALHALRWGMARTHVLIHNSLLTSKRNALTHLTRRITSNSYELSDHFTLIWLVGSLHSACINIWHACTFDYPGTRLIAAPTLIFGLNDSHTHTHTFVSINPVHLCAGLYHV